MIYQTNTLLSFVLIILSSVILIKYVDNNRQAIFFWFNQPCNHEVDCLKRYFGGFVSPKDSDFLELLREDHLVEPPANYEMEGFNIYMPLWRNLVNWQEVQEGLKNVWENQPPGFFVEVGAVDGIFMSQTIFLERNLSWTGLLIEPDPRSYELLKTANRNAWLSDVCIYPDAPTKRNLWMRTLDEDLPFHFQQILLARSKLNEETMIGDEERGTIVWKLCTPLASLLLAGNFKEIDLLSISTGHHNDEKKILDTIRSKDIDIKTLLIQYPSSRFFQTKYPAVKGYILDMSHSQLLVKFYVKEKHCELVQKGNCKKMNYYDTIEACIQYFCLGHLTVWTYDPSRYVQVPIKPPGK